MTTYNISFRDPSIKLNDIMLVMFELRQKLAEYNPEVFSTWYLAGDSKEDALLYEAFDSQGPTTAALAVLKEENKGSPLIGGAIWNGREDSGAARALFLLNGLGGPSTLELTTSSNAINLAQAIKIVSMLALRLRPPAVWVSTSSYESKKVFADRPGAGWMIYLPLTLAEIQVPEAHEVVPVMDGKERIGTILVTVTAEPFAAKNKEHVAAANALEVRLVDLDVLPLYTDF